MNNIRDWDQEQFNALKQICLDSNIASDPNGEINEGNLISQLTQHRRFNETFTVNFFAQDIYNQHFTTNMKDYFADCAFESGFVDAGLWILICNAMHIAMIEGNCYEKIKMSFAIRRKEKLSQLSSGMMQNILQSPLDVFKNISIGSREKWKRKIQVMFYDISKDVKNEQLLMIETAGNFDQTVDFMKSFFQEWPSMKSKQLDIVQLN